MPYRLMPYILLPYRLLPYRLCVHSSTISSPSSMNLLNNLDINIKVASFNFALKRKYSQHHILLVINKP